MLVGQTVDFTVGFISLSAICPPNLQILRALLLDTSGGLLFASVWRFRPLELPLSEGRYRWSQSSNQGVAEDTVGGRLAELHGLLFFVLASQLLSPLCGAGVENGIGAR